MLANILTGLVALIHLYILVLEMFLWDTPRGRKAFGTTEAFAKESKVLAANQGLYNGFLAAGLIWGTYLGDAGDPVKIFFLLCVAVAGVRRRDSGRSNPLDSDRSGAARPGGGVVHLTPFLRDFTST